MMEPATTSGNSGACLVRVTDAYLKSVAVDSPEFCGLIFGAPTRRTAIKRLERKWELVKQEPENFPSERVAIGAVLGLFRGAINEDWHLAQKEWAASSEAIAQEPS